MRVIVTRPEPAGTKTGKRLAELGHIVVSLPLFAADHLENPVSRARARAAAAIVLTSSETLRALSACPPDVKAALTALPAFAVGKTTAAAARSFGFADIHVSDGNGETLAEEIADKKALLHDRPLLYLAGEPRSPGLEQGLTRRGMPFQTITCYRMRPVAHDAQTLWHCVAPAGDTAVLLYSAEAARRLTEIGARMGADWMGAIAAFVCLSPAIASVLPAETLEKQRVAAEPTERALLSLIGPAA